MWLETGGEKNKRVAKRRSKQPETAEARGRRRWRRRRRWLLKIRPCRICTPINSSPRFFFFITLITRSRPRNRERRERVVTEADVSERENKRNGNGLIWKISTTLSCIYIGVRVCVTVCENIRTQQQTLQLQNRKRFLKYCNCVFVKNINQGQCFLDFHFFPQIKTILLRFGPTRDFV